MAVFVKSKLCNEVLLPGNKVFNFSALIYTSIDSVKSLLIK